MSPCVSPPTHLGSVSTVSQRGTLFAPSINASHSPQRSPLAGCTHPKGEYMRETGILSIVRRGPTYQVRYTSFNPYDIDRLSYPCSDEDALVTLLHHCWINDWSLTQPITALGKGEVAVLPVVLLETQLQAYFPPQRPRVLVKIWECQRSG